MVHQNVVGGIQLGVTLQAQVKADGKLDSHTNEVQLSLHGWNGIRRKTATYEIFKRGVLFNVHVLFPQLNDEFCKNHSGRFSKRVGILFALMMPSVALLITTQKLIMVTLLNQRALV